MRVEILASSSAGNAYTVSSGEHRLLLDAGIPFQDLRRKLAYRVAGLDACLLTHEHGDHSRSVPQLMAAGVNVYASAGTWAELGIKPSFRARVVRDQRREPIGHWTVLPLQAVHDAVEPLSFLIGAPTGKCLYLTDTAYCPFRFSGLSHVLIEANFSEQLLQENVESGGLNPAQAARTRRNHMSIERAVDLLKTNDMSQVVEIHLLHLSNGNSDAIAFRDAVRAATGRPVFIAPETTP